MSSDCHSPQLTCRHKKFVLTVDVFFTCILYLSFVSNVKQFCSVNQYEV